MLGTRLDGVVDFWERRFAIGVDVIGSPCEVELSCPPSRKDVMDRGCGSSLSLCSSSSLSALDLVAGLLREFEEVGIVV